MNKYKYSNSISDQIDTNFFGVKITRSVFTVTVFFMSIVATTFVFIFFGFSKSDLKPVGPFVIVGVLILFLLILLLIFVSELSERFFDSVYVKNLESYSILKKMVRSITAVLVYMIDALFSLVFGIGIFLMAFYR